MSTILVVDDDITLLASLGVRLEETGYTVLKTSEAEPAEIIFGECRPDLVILEVKTSNDKGWELLERFAEQTPVLVLSSYGREEDVVRGLQAGAVDYLAKPYRSDELMTRIRLRIGAGNHQNNQHEQHQHVAAAAPHHTTAASSEARAGATPPAHLRDDDRLPYEHEIDTLQDSAFDDGHGRRPAQESAFMDEAEELALLRADSAIPLEEEEPLTGDTTLGHQLLAERKRRRVTLVQAENELHIRMWYLQAMEEEKFTLLPRGPMAAQMLRSYATYLGLDVPRIMEEYQRTYATSNTIPVPSLGLGIDRNSFSAPPWLIWVAAIVLALVVSGASIFYLDPEGAMALGNNLRDLVTSLTP